MERNREGRRGGGGAGGSASAALRRPRVSGPKDVSDEDERMEDAPETRPWERPKKERINSFHISVAGNPRNKRKRQGPQDAQVPGRSTACDDADESTEETENVASEDDDEPPPPPILRRPGKSRSNGKVKSEDEIVMDRPAVPRKARSLMPSSSRFTLLRRQSEPLPADSSRQQSPVAQQTSLNGISSSNIQGKPGRRLKSGGAKVRGIKVPKVSEPATISDKEVEVAEALFDLARSFPSHSGTTPDQKQDTKLEAEVVKAASPPHVPTLSPAPVAQPNTSGPGSSSLPASGSNANGNTPPQIQSVILPTAEAPKRKRPRIVPRQEECRAAATIRAGGPGGGSYSSSPSGVMHSPVGEVEQTTASEKSQLLPEEGHLEPSKAKVAVESPVTQLPDIEDTTISSAEHRSKGQIEAKDSEDNLQYSSDVHEWKTVCTESKIPSPSNVKVEASADASENNNGCAKLELPSRPAEVFYDNDSNSAKLKIDLMAPMKLPSKEDTVHDTSADQHISSADISITCTSHLAEAPHVKVEHSCDSHKDAEDVDKVLKEEEMTEESRKIKERAESVKKEQKEEAKDQTSAQVQKEQMPTMIHNERPAEGEREKDRDSAKLLGPGLVKTQKPDTGNLPTSSFLMSTLPATASSSAPVALAGWMPQFGYYGSGAPSWTAGASLPGVNIDGKTPHPAVQLPHIAVLPPVPRMNHCASHVYLAHFIYREQRLRHTLWPSSLCRGTPYNLNIPPVNIHDKEKMGATNVDPARKAPTQQAGLAFGFSVSQSSSGVTVNSGTLGSSTTGNSVSAPSLASAGGVSIDAGPGTAAGGVMSMAPAHYLQAMMQQNGFTPFSFPLSGPPGQAAQFFNSPFYPAHLMPTLPQLQSLAQAPQALNMQKQQQGLRSVPHSTSSQHLQPSPQQLQLQLAPQSPPNAQQPQQHLHNHHLHHHMGTPTQKFGAHSEEDSTLGGESHSTAESRIPAMQRSMCGQGPSNLPNLNVSPSSLMLTTSVPALPSHHQDVSLVAALGGKHTSKSQLVQQQQLIPQNTGPGSGLQMKASDPSMSQGYSPMAMSSVNRGSVGPSPLGLVSVASVMATQGHAVLQGASENTRVHGQQQQVFAGQNQQYNQRTVPRAPVSVIEDTFVSSSNKGRDFIEDRKSSVKQAGGPPLNLTRVDMEVSSSSVQGSPTSGSSAPAPRLANNFGRTLNLTTPTGARNPRPVSSVGTGQVPHLQSQTSKQPMSRTKCASGPNMSPATAPPAVSSYVPPGNLGKIPGVGLPFPGSMTPCSQGLKQGQTALVKVQRTSQGPGIPAASSVPPQGVLGTSMTKNSGQQARSNQQGTSSTGTPPRMPPVSAHMLPSGPLSLSTSPSQSVLKAAGVPASKSPSNGKGTVPTSKSGLVSVKRSSVTGPALSSAVGPGQNMSVKAPLQQKSQGQLPLPQFSQQQVTAATQHQQLGTKHQVYHQQQPQQGSQFKQSLPPQAQFRPQSFLPQHHQQYLQHSHLQQQSLPQQQTQQPSSHYFQQNPQNSASQHGHTHQHLRHDQQHPHLQQQVHSMSSSSSATTNNVLSLSPPNLTLGTGIPGNSSGITNTDGADQFQGPGSRPHLSKAASNPGNQLSSGGIPKNSMVLHPSSTTVSGQQIGNPLSGSSHYLQLAPVLGVKSTEQKTLPEGGNREEFSGIRHLPSSSNSQPPLVSNPSSS